MEAKLQLVVSGMFKNRKSFCRKHAIQSFENPGIYLIFRYILRYSKQKLERGMLKGQFLDYLHSDYYAYLCMWSQRFDRGTPSLLQGYVNPGNLKGIKNWNLYLIYGAGRFWVHCPCLGIYRLLLILSTSLSLWTHFPDENWTHTYYVTKFTNQHFNPLGYYHMRLSSITPTDQQLTKSIWSYLRPS